MAIYHVLGNSILTGTEFRVKATEVAERAKFAEANVAGFTEIGLNKPLTAQIRHVYTGQFPKHSFFSGTKDMLVTSAMKDVSVFNAASRAVNFLRKDVGANSGFDSPAATEQGTPLVWYTPAVTSSSTILTLEIVLMSFRTSWSGRFRRLFQALPAFRFSYRPAAICWLPAR